jgi:hypothetical protein
VKIILRRRQSGRTDELIRMCAAAEKLGEVSYIICLDQPEASRIFQRAHELDLVIGFPITLNEFLKHEYYARTIKNFYIDNADHLLRSLTPVTIKAIVMEEVVEKGVLQGDQYPKGVSEERIREIAKEEASKALLALRDKFGSFAQRADGNANARDLFDSLSETAQEILPPNPAEDPEDLRV